MEVKNRTYSHNPCSCEWFLRPETRSYTAMENDKNKNKFLKSTRQIYTVFNESVKDVDNECQKLVNATIKREREAENLGKQIKDLEKNFDQCKNDANLSSKLKNLSEELKKSSDNVEETKGFIMIQIKIYKGKNLSNTYNNLIKRLIDLRNQNVKDQKTVKKLQEQLKKHRFYMVSDDGNYKPRFSEKDDYNYKVSMLKQDEDKYLSRKEELIQELKILEDDLSHKRYGFYENHTYDDLVEKINKMKEGLTKIQSLIDQIQEMLSQMDTSYMESQNDSINKLNQEVESGRNKVREVREKTTKINVVHKENLLLNYNLEALEQKTEELESFKNELEHELLNHEERINFVLQTKIPQLSVDVETFKEKYQNIVQDFREIIRDEKELLELVTGVLERFSAVVEKSKRSLEDCKICYEKNDESVETLVYWPDYTQRVGFKTRKLIIQEDIDKYTKKYYKINEILEKLSSDNSVDNNNEKQNYQRQSNELNLLIYLATAYLEEETELDIIVNIVDHIRDNIYGVNQYDDFHYHDLPRDRIPERTELHDLRNVLFNFRRVLSDLNRYIEQLEEQRTRISNNLQRIGKKPLLTDYLRLIEKIDKYQKHAAETRDYIENNNDYYKLAQQHEGRIRDDMDMKKWEIVLKMIDDSSKICVDIELYNSVIENLKDPHREDDLKEFLKYLTPIKILKEKWEAYIVVKIEEMASSGDGIDVKNRFIQDAGMNLKATRKMVKLMSDIESEMLYALTQENHALDIIGKYVLQKYVKLEKKQYFSNTLIAIMILVSRENVQSIFFNEFINAFAFFCYLFSTKRIHLRKFVEIKDNELACDLNLEKLWQSFDPKTSIEGCCGQYNALRTIRLCTTYYVLRDKSPAFLICIYLSRMRWLNQNKPILYEMTELDKVVGVTEILPTQSNCYQLFTEVKKIIKDGATKSLAETCKDIYDYKNFNVVQFDMKAELDETFRQKLSAAYIKHEYDEKLKFNLFAFINYIRQLIGVPDIK